MSVRIMPALDGIHRRWRYARDHDRPTNSTRPRLRREQLHLARQLATISNSFRLPRRRSIPVQSPLVETDRHASLTICCPNFNPMIATVLFHVLRVSGAAYACFAAELVFSTMDTGFRRLAAPGTRWGGWL